MAWSQASESYSVTAKEWLTMCKKQHAEPACLAWSV